MSVSTATYFLHFEAMRMKRKIRQGRQILTLIMVNVIFLGPHSYFASVITVLVLVFTLASCDNIFREREWGLHSGVA